MQAQQRVRYSPIFHQRLLSRTYGDGGMKQKLSLPNEIFRVANAAVHLGKLTQFGCKTFNDCMLGKGDDVHVEWNIQRPNMSRLKCSSYEGSKLVGRFITSSTIHDLKGLLSQKREYRDSILYYSHDQVDIAHAMPSIVFHYFKHLGLCGLERCIDILDDLTARGDDRRKLFKRVLIAKLQRSPLDTTPEVMDILQMDCMCNLHEEVGRIEKEMVNAYPGFVELVKAKRVHDKKPESEWFASAIQIFYNDVESSIQAGVMARMNEEWPAVKDRVLINCDALFIPKTIGVPIKEVCDRLAGWVNGICPGIGLRYVHKPLVNAFPLEDIMARDDLDEAFLRIFGLSTADHDEYQREKCEFEKRHFYLFETSRVYVLNHRLKMMHSHKPRALSEELYPYMSEFIKKWMADKDRRCYTRIVHRPPPLMCGIDEFNLWDFNGKFLASSLPDLDGVDDVIELSKPVLDCLFRMVSGDKAMFDYLIKWLAHMFQRPGEKMTQFLGFYGAQGIGKNVLFEQFLIDGLLGRHLGVCYGSLDQLLGEKHECNWMGKLLVVVHETNYGDFSKNYERLKDFTGTLERTVNQKNQPTTTCECLARVILLSNHPNAFAEKDVDGRRAGFLAVGKGFRDVPDAITILRSPKHRKAFLIYLESMVDLTGWDPELDRVGGGLQDVNKAVSIKTSPGKLMEVILYTGLDRMYELYSKTEMVRGVPTRSDMFLFPAMIMEEIWKDVSGFKEVGQNKHVVELSAAAFNLSQLGMDGVIVEPMTKKARGYMAYKRPGARKSENRLCFQVDYPLLMKALESDIAKHRLDEFVEVDLIRDQVIKGINDFHESMVNEKGFEYTNPGIQDRPAKPQRKARYNPDHDPLYEVLENGSSILTTNDLEMVNKELGEAYVDEKNGVLVHQHINKEIPIEMGDRMFQRLEMKYPFYIRDRTT